MKIPKIALAWGLVGIDNIPWEIILSTLHWEDKEITLSPAARSWTQTHAEKHGQDEILICLAGKHHYGIHSRAIDLSPGSAALIPHGTPHDSRYASHHEPCIDLWLHLFPHGKANINFAQHHPKKKLILTPITLAEPGLLGDLQKACSLLNDPRMANLNHRKKTGNFLLYLLHAIIEQLDKNNHLKESVNEHLILENIKSHASRNLTDSLTLEELAKLAGYSPFHFHRMFKRFEGTTPRAFVETKRVELACRLLKEGLSVTAAAMDSGFSTSSQFNRVFKKHLNLSPSRWIDKLADARPASYPHSLSR